VVLPLSTPGAPRSLAGMSRDEPKRATTCRDTWRRRSVANGRQSPKLLEAARGARAPETGRFLMTEEEREQCKPGEEDLLEDLELDEKSAAEILGGMTLNKAKGADKAYAQMDAFIKQ
jgi:hypothetical protein